jgi:hypothetical protein
METQGDKSAPNHPRPRFGDSLLCSYPDHEKAKESPPAAVVYFIVTAAMVDLSSNAWPHADQPILLLDRDNALLVFDLDSSGRAKPSGGS